MISAIPVSAAEQNEINLLDGATYTLYDPDGNIVEIQPLFVIGEGIGIPANHYVVVSTKFWYNGTGMDFYASVSGGKVSNLSPVLTNDYGQYTLPNFKATNGDWYGKTSFNRKEYGYCQIGFVNQGTTFITIDSLTGIEN